MCGVHLIINQKNFKDQRPIQEMMQCAAHRGPDQSGWTNLFPGSFLAGNRLKTLDLGNAANQPIITADGKGVLVWNGALYNYQDLRNELLTLGYVFKSQSDSEVLLYWLYHYGLEGTRSLRGMYALVFADLRSKKVTIARDPFGMKPLHYARVGQTWLFSSETNPILASGIISPKLDTRQYEPYHYLRHSFPDQTFYSKIKQVLPGTALVIDESGKKVNALHIRPSKGKLSTPSVGQVKEMLVDAVLNHFHADVPVGIVLSGGIDSSLLYHLWYRQTGVPLFTFTAGFEKKYRKAYPDARFAEALAASYHGEHSEITVRPEDVLGQWEHYIADLDQPIGDSASFLTWMIAKEAKKKVKILVSGAGADELFGGYNRHRAYMRYLNSPNFWMYLANLPINLPSKFRRLAKMKSSISPDPCLTYLNFASLQPISESLKRKIWTFFPKGLPPYKTALEWDRTVYLVNDVLKIHDNANMAHGVEGRAPYIDWPLISLSSHLSEEEHQSLSGKKWLREILREEGLAPILKRKKLGFGLPIKEWLSDHKGFREFLFTTLQEFGHSAGEVLPEEMRNMSLQPSLYVKSSFLQLWNIFVLASWIKQRNL